MPYKLLEPPKSFQKDFARLPESVRIAFRRALNGLVDNPLACPPLSGPWAGCRKVRVGGFRLLYRVNVEEKTIELVKCGSRGQVYRHL